MYIGVYIYVHKYKQTHVCTYMHMHISEHILYAYSNIAMLCRRAGREVSRKENVQEAGRRTMPHDKPLSFPFPPNSITPVDAK